MKRILMVLTVALVIAALMVVMAVPAFAANGFTTQTTNKQGKVTQGNPDSPAQTQTTRNKAGNVVVGQSER